MGDSAIDTCTPEIDEEIATFVRALNDGYASVPGFAALPLPERRAAAERIRARWRQGGPVMARTIDLDIGGRPARIHVPNAAAELPAMLYLHGGGWTMFSIDTHDRLMREYAARAGTAVVGLDYSLSPEAKFPAALDESVAALAWLTENGAEYRLDGSRLAVGGDSAGANLAVAACLRLRDCGRPLPRALLLNYGAFDPQHRPSYDRFGGPEFMLTVAEMDRFWADYTNGPAELEDRLVAPLRAELSGLPAVFLAIAECDILLDANQEMATRLAQAGVPVEAHVYAGATHSFLEAVAVSKLADRALDDAARWLRARLAPG